MKKSRLFPVLLMLFALTACDKSEPVNPVVTAEELVGYQMYWGLIDPNGALNLRLLYFEKSGNDIKATLDGVGVRNILNITVSNNVLALDLNGNGSVVYTFEFDKSKEGIKIKSSKFYNLNNPGYQMSGGSAISPLSAFASVKNEVFQLIGGATTIRFNVDTWLYGKYPNTTGTYYECGKGGFKARIQGVDHFGIAMATPTEDGTSMILQASGIKELDRYTMY